jgi:pimeloyl-ACP methyl ester carboxylesterase
MTHSNASGQDLTLHDLTLQDLTLQDLTLQDLALQDLALQDPAFVEVGSGADIRKIAVRARAGAPPGLMWLGGFKSDMQGTKALALDGWAAEHGRACVRFDYSGHGTSEGAFADGTIGRWLEESVAVFDRFCSGPQIAIGSSMGGWMALLLARALAQRKAQVPAATLAGLVLIAPAPDFTEELMWKSFSPEIRAEIETKGVWLRPSEYGEPYPITRRLIEEGRNHLLLGSAIEVGCPVRILQGAKDPDVPWQHALALAHRLPSDDVVLTMIQDGDHRLSRPQDIARIIAAVKELG